MIRHIVMLHLRPDHDAGELSQIMDGLAALPRIAVHHGPNRDMEGKTPNHAYGWTGDFKEWGALGTDAADPGQRGLGGLPWGQGGGRGGGGGEGRKGGADANGTGEAEGEDARGDDEERKTRAAGSVPLQSWVARRGWCGQVQFAPPSLARACAASALPFSRYARLRLSFLSCPRHSSSIFCAFARAARRAACCCSRFASFSLRIVLSCCTMVASFFSSLS